MIFKHCAEEDPAKYVHFCFILHACFWTDVNTITKSMENHFQPQQMKKIDLKYFGKS